MNQQEEKPNQIDESSFWKLATDTAGRKEEDTLLEGMGDFLELGPSDKANNLDDIIQISTSRMQNLEEELKQEREEKDQLRRNQKSFEDQVTKLTKLVEGLSNKIDVMLKNEEKLEKEIEGLKRVQELQKRSLSKLLTNQKERLEESMLEQERKNEQEKKLEELEKTVANLEESKANIPTMMNQMQRRVDSLDLKVEEVKARSEQSILNSTLHLPRTESERVPQQILGSVFRGQSNSSEMTVYRTNTGKKYHSRGCQWLYNSCIPISIIEARALGLTRCSQC
eukprot:TRINITY_DN723_c0_g1_i6.p1 TRINITY_DN723_c0_g1~~TRINITY_DN723_c0_g1_i6.p1  ORF type:complete len:282 (-),score=48.74 TRINITY_DN723_c0_g1_i6:104-949(-)